MVFLLPAALRNGRQYRHGPLMLQFSLPAGLGSDELESCLAGSFQLEFESSTRRWYMRTMQDKYFTLQPGGGIQANENKR